jgi:REP element-mobilizing transposase RayT
MPYDRQKHHRRSIRLKGYDYAQAGAYFVTLVSYQRENYFGEVVDGKVQLSPLGEIIREEWFRSTEIRKEIRLNEDEFVIMPNHIHGIVWIVAVERAGADSIRPNDEANVGAHGMRPGGMRSKELLPTDIHPRSAIPARAVKSLGSFIAGFKSSVTRRARQEFDFEDVWQRNYYDHIIRSEPEFQQIWMYIDANPLNWEVDRLHPKAGAKQFKPDC